MNVWPQKVVSLSGYNDILMILVSLDYSYKENISVTYNKNDKLKNTPKYRFFDTRNFEKPQNKIQILIQGISKKTQKKYTYILWYQEFWKENQLWIFLTIPLAT